MRSEEEIKAKLKELEERKNNLFKIFYPENDHDWYRLIEVKAQMKALQWVLGIIQNL